MDNRELRLMAAIDSLRHSVAADISSVDHRLIGSIMSTRQDLEGRLQRVETRFDALELRLTVRMGGMVAIAVAILAALIKF